MQHLVHVYHIVSWSKVHAPGVDHDPEQLDQLERQEARCGLRETSMQRCTMPQRPHVQHEARSAMPARPACHSAWARRAAGRVPAPGDRARARVARAAGRRQRGGHRPRGRRYAARRRRRPWCARPAARLELWRLVTAWRPLRPRVPHSVRALPVAVQSSGRAALRGARLLGMHALPAARACHRATCVSCWACLRSGGAAAAVGQECMCGVEAECARVPLRTEMRAAPCRAVWLLSGRLRVFCAMMPGGEPGAPARRRRDARWQLGPGGARGARRRADGRGPGRV